MTDQDTLERRVGAVERALTDGEDDIAALEEAGALNDRVNAVEADLDDLRERLEELEAATQAVRGYVGNVRSVNRDVEQRADAAVAAVERLETRLDDLQGRRTADGEYRRSVDDEYREPADDEYRRSADGEDRWAGEAEDHRSAGEPQVGSAREPPTRERDGRRSRDDRSSSRSSGRPPAPPSDDHVPASGPPADSGRPSGCHDPATGPDERRRESPNGDARNAGHPPERSDRRSNGRDPRSTDDRGDDRARILARIRDLLS